MHDRATRLIERFGGKTASRLFAAPRKRQEHVVAVILFEEFRPGVLRPIDGHNLPLLVETFKFLKSIDHPVLLHILTQKGRGFSPPSTARKSFTASGPTIRRQARLQMARLRTLRSSPTPWPILREDPRIVAITAAMPTAPASITSGPATPNAISTSASPRSMQSFCRWNGYARLSPGLCHLFHFLAARLRPRCPRCLPAEATCPFLHGSRRTLRR